MQVPGLADNHQLGIRSELIAVSAGDIVSFFQPSIERIRLLVAEQIAASKTPITAIILVGGYGECQFLKEELEDDSLLKERKIRIHQSPCAWTSVVRGAVMTGIQEANPEGSVRIRIGNYKARKHYGTELTVIYKDSIHAKLFDKRRWDGLTGGYEVEVMDWFINQVSPLNKWANSWHDGCLPFPKGDSVAESRPFFRNFLVTSKVNHGKPRRIYLIIYSDETSQVAPLSKTDTVRELCTVEADLSHIPESQITKVRGSDGLLYFTMDGQIEIVCKYILSFTSLHSPSKLPNFENR